MKRTRKVTNKKTKQRKRRQRRHPRFQPLFPRSDSVKTHNTHLYSTTACSYRCKIEIWWGWAAYSWNYDATLKISTLTKKTGKTFVPGILRSITSCFSQRPCRKRRRDQNPKPRVVKTAKKHTKTKQKEKHNESFFCFCHKKASRSLSITLPGTENENPSYNWKKIE